MTPHILKDNARYCTDQALQTIPIDDTEVRCELYKESPIRRVQSADHYIIKGHTEMIIDAFVERNEYDDGKTSKIAVVEPTPSFKHKYPVMLASCLCLVDINSAPTVKVRLLNPFPTDVSIKQDTVIGTAALVENQPTQMLDLDADAVENDFSNIRRLQFSNLQPDTAFLRKTEYKKGTSSHVHDSSLKELVPKHLKTLFKESSEGKTLLQKTDLAQTLSEYGDVFSKDDNDLSI